MGRFSFNFRASCGGLVEKFVIEPFSEPNHQILEGSFSAVSTPNFATKASYFSILRDLQDSKTFAPFESQVEKFLEKPPRYGSKRKNNLIPSKMPDENDKNKMGCRGFNDGRGGAAAALKERA